MINIDLDGLVLGRAASIIAQKLLEGEVVNAYNAEKVLITGNKLDIFAKYKERMDYKGKADPEKAPKYPKRPDMVFKRAVRNMLPHKKPRGRAAFKNLKVYMSNFDNVKVVSLEVAKVKSGLKYITLEVLAQKLGARV
jgi:large subunit ribosomal protein L13